MIDDRDPPEGDAGSLPGGQAPPGEQNSAVLAAIASVGVKSLAEIVVSSSKEFVAELRKQPFLYNVLHSGRRGNFQVAGIRIANPHPDVIYIGNFTVEKPAARLQIACILRANFNVDLDPFVHRRVNLGFDAPGSMVDADTGALSAQAAESDLKGMLDATGLTIAPLSHQDLVLLFESPGRRSFEACKAILRLAVETQRTEFTSDRIELFLRNKNI